MNKASNKLYTRKCLVILPVALFPIVMDGSCHDSEATGSPQWELAYENKDSPKDPNAERTYLDKGNHMKSWTFS